MALRNWLKASAIVTALGSVALMVTQSIFQDWWNSSENKARAELDRQQTEYLSKSVEAIDRSTDAVANLNRKLEEIARRAEEAERRQAAPAPQPPTSQSQRSQSETQPVAAAPEEPASGSMVVEAPREEEVAAVATEAVLPPAAPDAMSEAGRPAAPPATATAQPEPAPVAPPGEEARRPEDPGLDEARVFGVFEAQTFDLCGHKGFSAELIVDGAGSEILLKSRNRSVPGAGFRGFEKILPLKAPVELWTGCTVAIGTVETTGTARRMIISVAEGKRA
ncbi:hypothetical protein [Nitratireductor pacificus]|uniref:Uncharacterized protein n=1 Tax=Nitratireductor pacificus pht-3B TaxID=391937 RepID=K2N3C4_9HYPH|nr:hypothetical protein [Nitratireductor pacificus]EKF18733.1 hypothetical protein NA2_11135 [Nitratireductor pacificus pht-3B]